MHLRIWINKLFNVGRHEWPRITIAWCLKLFTHITYIMGWTFLVALFVSKKGIENLPLLFVANALFIMVGSAIYSFLISKFRNEKLLFYTAVLAIIFFAISRVFYNGDLMTFLLFFMIAESVLLSQINIINFLFIETIFTPNEAQRAMPIVESAEPIGGIIGGAVVAVLSLYILPDNIVLFFIPFLVFFIITILSYMVIFKKVPRLKTEQEHEEHHKVRKMGRIKTGITHLKAIKYLKVLFLMVLCQWTFVMLLEFEFTKFVDEEITHQEEEGLWEGRTVHGAAIAPEHEVYDYDEYDEEEYDEDEYEEGSAHHAAGAASGDEHDDIEHEKHALHLTHGLGLLHILFHFLSFLMRLLFESRLFQRLGYMRSAMLHPIFTFIGVCGMSFMPGYNAAVALKATSEVMSGVYNDAYHNSYYGMKEYVIEHAKEFFEGVVRPLGLMSGTLLLLLYQFFIHDEELLVVAVNTSMFVLLAIMFWTLMYARKHYTNIAKRHLHQPGAHHIKFNALEVISQAGHDERTDILTKSIPLHKGNVRLKVKTLKALGELHDTDSIPEIIQYFDDPDDKVQLAAVESLEKFSNLGEHFHGNLFAKYRVIEALKELFLKTRSKKIQSAVVDVFKHISHFDIIPFLLEVLETADDDLRADCIYICGMFKDPSIAHYIEKYLESENPQVKANTIIALWQFPKFRLKLLVALMALLESKKTEDQIAGIYALGETGSIQEIPRLLKMLSAKSVEIRKHAAVALAKMNHYGSIEHLIELALHEDPEIALHTKKLLKRAHPNVKGHVDRFIEQEVSKRLYEILKTVKADKLEELDIDTLQMLRNEYELLEDEKEVMKIDEILKKKEEPLGED